MSFAFNGLTGTTVSISGSVTASPTLPQPTATQTLKQGYIHGGNSGATVITASAGKTFYCTGICVMGADVGFHIHDISNDGTIVLSCVSGAGTTSTGGVMNNVLLTGGVLFSVAATKSVTISTNGGAGTLYASIWGYEA